MRTQNEVRELLHEIKVDNLAGYKMPADVRRKKLQSLLNDTQEGNLEYKALYSAIHTFGEGDFREAEPLIEQFLEHEDPDLRNIALNVLGIHWVSKKHRKVFESFLFNEKEDDENRGMAAACLGVICRGSKDKAALRVLLSFFNDDDVDWFVRDHAYDAILDVWGVPYQVRPSAAKKLDYEKDVDWRLIREIEKYLES
jgi:hypothetical protein